MKMVRVYAADMEDLRQRLDELIEIGQADPLPAGRTLKFSPQLEDCGGT